MGRDTRTEHEYGGVFKMVRGGHRERGKKVGA